MLLFITQLRVCNRTIDSIDGVKGYVIDTVLCK